MPHAPHLHPLARAVLAALLVLLPASGAHANAGPPMRGGDLAGEPTGLEEIAIARETLEIDLRPLERGQPVVVDAQYALRNAGDARQVELMFVTASERAEGFEVWVDDDRVPAGIESIEPAALPAAWQPPGTTPAIDAGRDAIGYYPSNSYRGGLSVATFAPTIPAGASALRVRYQAEAVRHSLGDPLDAWQFAYSLAPARSWAAFGGLDLVVHAPPGWLIATEPALARAGDELRGAFDRVPADAVAITARAPLPPLYGAAGTVFTIVFIVTLIGGLALVLRQCWRLGKAGRRFWPAAIGLTLLWAVALFVVGMLGQAAPASMLPTAQRSTYGYGAAFAFIGVMLVAAAALVVGVSGGLIAGALGRRRAARMQGRV